MARIREAHVDEHGGIRVARPKRGGMLGALFALALVAGGVWAFDEIYGDRARAVQLSEAAPN